MLLFCGLAAILLPQEVIGLSAIAGVGGGAAGYWYYQLHEPSRDRKRIRQEAFDLANSPIAEVKFTNGDSCPFSPEGAVVATSRDVVFGIDTLNQLVRQIAIGQSGKLETDWIFGLEEFTEISVVKVPSGGLSKLAGKLSGVRNLTCPAIRLSTAARSHVHIRIVPDQLDMARNLVAKINMNRLSARQAT